MSASELLGRLDGEATGGPWQDARVARILRPRIGGAADADARLIATLRNALPEIVAVVEAAEWETNWHDGLYDLAERTGGDLGRTLAALTRKLEEV
jgi:hypothetical protein